MFYLTQKEKKNYLSVFTFSWLFTNHSSKNLYWKLDKFEPLEKVNYLHLQTDI